MNEIMNYLFEGSFEHVLLYNVMPFCLYTILELWSHNSMEL